jgi:hypothetical protein
VRDVQKRGPLQAAGTLSTSQQELICSGEPRVELMGSESDYIGYFD